MVCTIRPARLKRDENVRFDYLSAVGRALNGHWGCRAKVFSESIWKSTLLLDQTFGDVKAIFVVRIKIMIIRRIIHDRVLGR